MIGEDTTVNRLFKTAAAGVLALVLLAPAATPVWATQGERTETAETTDSAAVEIYTPQQLRKIGENPTASYTLMADLDMTGIEWKPVDFSGSLDGNGHAILNLTLSQPADNSAVTYDGNKKPYDTTLIGLFGSVKNASITNLKLLNVRAVVERDDPCYLAGLAGYAENVTISDCTVTGSLELRAYNQLFGVAGMVGFGTGVVERSAVDVTLICTDTDDKTKDEQFLGGVWCAGLIDVKDCNVIIDGYISEFGYVHSGGIAGMSIAYPVRPDRACMVTNNTVTGKITFFECNDNRRAYCDPYVGERLFGCNLAGCKKDFKRDERRTYDKELRPELCEEPVYTETVFPSDCKTYGYTSYTCEGCGYTYTDHYVPFVHTLTKWTLTQKPTTESEGLSTARCDHCGVQLTRIEEKLEPTQPPTEAPKPTAPVREEEPAPLGAASLLSFVVPAVGVLALALLVMRILVLLVKQISGKKTDQ